MNCFKIRGIYFCNKRVHKTREKSCPRLCLTYMKNSIHISSFVHCRHEYLNAWTWFFVRALYTSIPDVGVKYAYAYTRIPKYTNIISCIAYHIIWIQEFILVPCIPGTLNIGSCYIPELQLTRIFVRDAYTVKPEYNSICL